MALNNEKLEFWLMVTMPVSLAVKGQWFLNTVTVAFLRNGLRNRGRYTKYRYFLYKEKRYEYFSE